MIKLNIKPLSVNKAWKGRRFKTNDYKNYEKELLIMLCTTDVKLESDKSKLSVFIEFGFSNRGSDIDNGLKPFLDVLQKKYGFNDSRIYSLEVLKNIVKKGDEYIEYKIKELKN